MRAWWQLPWRLGNAARGFLRHGHPDARTEPWQADARQERRLERLAPVIIGGTGGSGTRVVARVLLRGGLYIGVDLYGSEDPPEFGMFSDRWINVFMSRDLWPSAPEVEACMARELAGIVNRHLAAWTPRRRAWGWKEPRSIFLVPFLHRQFPRMRFVHVLRDGRDMAFSANQNQLNKHSHTLLSPLETQWRQPLRSMLLWGRLNSQAAEYGERHLGACYLRVRFEDLCRNPRPTIERLFEFLGLDGDVHAIASDEVAPPASLGRWRSQDPETLARLNEIGRPALERFGYWGQG